MNRDAEGFIEARLDRALAYADWRLTFEGATLTHLHHVGSDHTALLLDTCPRGQWSFVPCRFGKRWLQNSEVTSVVQRAEGQEFEGSKLLNVDLVTNCLQCQVS